MIFSYSNQIIAVFNAANQISELFTLKMVFRLIQRGVFLIKLLKILVYIPEISDLIPRVL